MATVFSDQTIELILKLNFDQTNATVRRIYYKDPQDSTGYWDAYEKSAKAIYCNITPDVVGTWRFWAYIEINSNKYIGETAKQKVYAAGDD